MDFGGGIAKFFDTAEVVASEDDDEVVATERKQSRRERERRVRLSRGDDEVMQKDGEKEDASTRKQRKGKRTDS